MNRMRLDHAILANYAVFYSQALYNDLLFEVMLVLASQVVKGSNPTKLTNKLTNIQLEYKTIRSLLLAAEMLSVYSSGKEFLYVI